MATFKRFNLKSIADLESELKHLELHLPVDRNLSVLSDTVECRGWTLPNRFVVQPMEGFDADPSTSAPSDLTFRRYERFARGGAGLIWFESVVVEAEGKSNPRQLMLSRENLDVWKRLVEKTRKAAFDEFGHRIVTVLQISHSGRWSKPLGEPRPLVIHHNPALDSAVKIDKDYPVASDDELDRIRDLFIEHGRLAVEAGFDGVEMKAVHGYLSGEMLCAHTREGKYGGSYENRTRFVKDCSSGILAGIDRNHFVTARLTLFEPSPYPYGWGTTRNESAAEMDLEEPLNFAKELADLAQMPVFNFSIGYPRYIPYMNRPFNNPIAGAPVPGEHPLEGIVRFQQAGRELQAVLGEVPVVTAALGWLRDLMPPVAAGLVNNGWVKLIGQGRQSFAYPDSVKDILTKGKMDTKKICLTCSLCSQIMKDGYGRNGCPVRDASVYKQELMLGRRQAREKGLP